MNKKLISIALLAAGSLAAVAALPLPESVHKDFKARRAALGKKKKLLDAATDKKLTADERAAMEFLYTYMTDPDLAGYSPEFYLENVRSTLRAREEMPWGKTVPAREFLHFVLPLRVNNEALDMARPQFYAELRDRVKGLSMKDAILEVNHWCHEKVTYKPSDGRTSSPLSTVSQAIGRCGEESTFAVAALRSVGIPARQVYTPRWAHTDDNHAWVEVWADGEWHFIGACEPEPVLDLAWFNAPAARGMLMSTNVFGKYDGPEEKLREESIITTINVTGNYAPVKRGEVKVVDRDGKPVEDAAVSFGIYNYAEFYPVAVRRTDAAGNASLTTGKGDCIVWASDGENYGIGQLKGTATEPLTVILDRNADTPGELTFDITPPPARAATVTVTDAQRAENNRRFAQEDSIRNVYTATFATPESAAALARELDLDADRLTRIMLDSRGNHAALAEMFRSLEPRERGIALRLLENVTEKDCRDIPAEVVVSNASEFAPSGVYPLDLQYSYLLNPRISTERLQSFKEPFRKWLPEKKHGAFRENPAALAEWIDKKVPTDTRWNPLGLLMDPLAAANLERSDARSKKVLFVAAARSLGIPARIDPVRGEAQYYETEGIEPPGYIVGGDWHDVLRAEAPEAGGAVPKGKLQLTYTPQPFLKDPKYYTNFTLSRIVDGWPQLLEYPENGTASWLFGDPAEVDAGSYMLVTGQRLADGGVLADVKFFNVREGETTTLPLTIREDDSAVSVIGSLNAEDLYRDLATGTDKSILSTTGRGYYVLGILRNGHEPSVHTLNDISLLQKELSARGEKILLLFGEGEGSAFNPAQYPNLPSNVVIGEDLGGKIKDEIIGSLNLQGGDLPIFVIADTFNRIVFVSQGYTIGLGDRLLRTLQKIE